MPYLTVQEIETIAERIVRAYHRYCAQQNQTVTRIDPEIVTSNVLGLQIAYHKLSRFGHVLGLTCMLPVQIQVFDDIEHPEMCIRDRPDRVHLQRHEPADRSCPCKAARQPSCR